jgi:hypothetical protein
LALVLAGCADGTSTPPGETPTQPPGPTPTPAPQCTPLPPTDTPVPTPTPLPPECNTDNESCGPTTCKAEGSSTMLPGSNCQSCHSPGSLPDDLAPTTGSRTVNRIAAALAPTAGVAEDNLYWTIAGTAFTDSYGSGPLAGASLKVTDSKGKVVTLTTNGVGNFYSTALVTPPLTAKITANGKTFEMATPADTGACNSCHRCDGPPGGKLYGGPQPTPTPTPTPDPCPTPTPIPNVTFSSIDSSIFQPSCATSNCHGKGSASGGLALDSNVAYANLVNVPSQELTSMLLVKPGDPANSYLWHKLKGDQASMGGSGSTMPIGPALTSTQLQSVNQWIAEGAPNN